MITSGEATKKEEHLELLGEWLACPVHLLCEVANAGGKLVGPWVSVDHLRNKVMRVELDDGSLVSWMCWRR